MTKYIERDKKKLRELRRIAQNFQDDIVCAVGTDFMQNIAEAENRMIFDILKGLETLPAADVAEVVRCKDCVYWQDNNGGYPHEDCRWGKDETPDADDYCSFGEKMDGKGEGEWVTENG